MLVKVAKDSSVTLESPEDFKRFSVSIAASADELPRIRDAVSDAGNLIDGETMWVNEAWLRTAPGRIEGQKWQDAVSAMIAGAKKYGWVDGTNGSIKAHVVWAAPAI
jgi:hypothetical protein